MSIKDQIKKNLSIVILFVIFIVIIILIILLDCIGIDFFHNYLEQLVLVWTGIIVLFYTVVNYFIFNSQEESNRINKDPVLRMQWTDLGLNGYFINMKKIGEGYEACGKNIKGDNKILNKYYSYTDLEIKNEGNGTAKDIKFESVKIGKFDYKLRNITAIGPNGPTQIRYLGEYNSHEGKIMNNEIEAYKNPFYIILEYNDIFEKKYVMGFKVRKDYNDGFKIFGPKEIKNNDLENIKDNIREEIKKDNNAE